MNEELRKEKRQEKNKTKIQRQKRNTAIEK
jgi:hypothetical protein